MLSIIILITLVNLWIVINNWVTKEWMAVTKAKFAQIIDKDKNYIPIISLLGILGIASIISLKYSSITTDEFILGYYFRLRPIIFWLIGISTQTLVAFRLFRFGFDLRALITERKTFYATLFSLSLIALFTIWIIRSKISIVQDLYGWGDPGVPITPIQVLSALGIAITSTTLLDGMIWTIKRGAVGKKINTFISIPAINSSKFIAIILWVVTSFLWSSVELKPSYFSPDPLPPNFEYYPYSDAGLFDKSAHLLLIGQGFETNVRRPLYSAFLALSQAIFGIGYDNVLKLQIPILALIPPLLFLLTEELHHRISGILVAVFAIFHEINSINLAGIVNVSHSKLLMSDLPTALGIIAFTYLIIRWVKSPFSRLHLPVIAGGVIGLTALIRVQSLIILPPVIILAWFCLGGGPKRRIIEILLLGLGVFLAISPWFYRNWQKTGEFTFGTITTDPSQIGLIDQRYSFPNEQETNLIYEDANSEDYSTQVLKGSFDFIVRHPDEFLRFTSAHFVNNQISSLLVLPSKFTIVDTFKSYFEMIPYWDGSRAKLWEQCCRITAIIDELPYWDHWNGIWLTESINPIILNLFLISLGIGTIWSRQNITGIIPLIVSLSYSFGNALIRFSGWRFNLPVDWIGYLLYGIGITQLIFWITALIVNRPINLSTTPHFPTHTRKKVNVLICVLCLGIFAISSTILITEVRIPSRYDENSVDQTLVALENNGLLGLASIDKPFIDQFLDGDHSKVIVGRALYPRFYTKGIGEPGSGWPSFQPRDYNRLGFLVIGTQEAQVVLPLPGPPDEFDHSSDVLVLGCKRNNYIYASLVISLNTHNQAILRSESPDWACQGSSE
jgi:hypothetical protein